MGPSDTYFHYPVLIDVISCSDVNKPRPARSSKDGAFTGSVQPLQPDETIYVGIALPVQVLLCS